MPLLNLSAFDSMPLQRDPYDFLVVPHFLSSDQLESINKDYPAIRAPRNFDLAELDYGPAFEQLTNELTAPPFAESIANKFDIDLDNTTTSITVRQFCEASDGNIHTDHKSKIITVLLYFNCDWQHNDGQLRLLRSASDIEDFAVEVPPTGGTLLAFRRCDHSYHGHKRFIGERRMLQLNWIRASHAARYLQKFDRFTTHFGKRLARLIQ